MVMKRERGESPEDQGTICSGLMTCHAAKVPRFVQQTIGVNQGVASKRDYLIQLPEDLLLSVLSYLPLRNIVQTSIISHYLKNAASSISRLNFNLCDLFMIEENSDLVAKVEEPKCCCGKYKYRFVDRINHFLKFHQGKNLSAVTLSFCLGLEDKEEIDRWIRFAIKKDVMLLNLVFYCNERRYRSHASYAYDPSIQNRYIVSTELFEGLSTNLREFWLASCEICPKFSVKFHGLIKLTLEDVPLLQKDLQSMFLCLPKLKTLRFFRCLLPGKLSFGSLPSLSELFIGHCPGVLDVELCNTALWNVHFMVRQPIRCNINGAPHLNLVGQSTDGDGLPYLFTSLAKDIPSLKWLFIYTCSDWGKYIPEDIGTFKNLRFLRLSFRKHTRFDVLKVISILRALPVLGRLQLQTNCREDVERDKLELGEHVHPYLTQVEITTPLFTPSQLELTRYLLKYTAALKCVVIWKAKLNEYYYMLLSEKWSDDERGNVCQLLKEFSLSGGLTESNSIIELRR